MAQAFERCAPASEERGDELYGTAPPARRFLLVEKPGAWGRNALHDSRLDAPVVASLLAQCRSLDARLLLIRRAQRDPDAPRRWAVVDAREGVERTWWGSYADDSELRNLDLERPAGELSTAPVFLVCTHGRRDACCAQRGWPVAAALTSEFPDWTWQCSHVGGDRFAANLVVLPHGLYYGHLTADTAIDVARRHLLGRVMTAALRGRSCFAPAVQAAQHFARLELGGDAIDMLQPRATTRAPEGAVEVSLAGADGGVVVVSLREHESEPVERLTCSAVGATRMRTWELLGITARSVDPQASRG